MFEIRSAKIKDLYDIGELWVELINFHNSFDDRFEVPKDGKKEYVKQCKKAISSNNYCVLIAENLLTKEIVGCIIGYIAESSPIFVEQYYGFIADISVTKKYRGQGVGTGLYSAILQWFAKRNVPSIQLNAAHRNEMSQRFWRKQGFSDYLDHLYMRLK